MKSNFKLHRRFGLGVLAVGFFILSGCDSLPPVVGAYPPAGSAGSSRSLVIDFESATPMNINPNLFELSNPPGYGLVTPGSVTFVNNFPLYVSGSAYLQLPGYNGTGYAVHAAGSINDPGTGAYPAADLQVQMEGGAQYNAGFFSGVKFYLNVSSIDTATKRVFAIPLYNTQGAPQGGCTANCYDHFSLAYSTIAQDAWVPFIVNFKDLKRSGFGSAITPSDLSGANLGKVLWLMWEESRDNTSGISQFDFSVDQIEFF